MRDLNAIRVFVQVVRSRGFSAAAQSLGMSKAAVSKHVARLEADLGARLLNRTTRRLSLTEVGAAFYDRCVRLIADVEEAESLVGRLHGEPRGTLKVSAPTSFGIRHVAPQLPHFMRRHPALRVDLSFADRFVDVVEEGFDVVVRIGRLAESSLVARRLAPFRRVVCASPDYWAEAGTPDRPDDLRRHACLLYAYQNNPQEWPFSGPGGPTAVHVDGPMVSNNGEALRAAAEAGLGVALLPTFLVSNALNDGKLVRVLADYEETDLAIHAVYPHARHLSVKVRAFVDYLVETFRDSS